MSVISESTYDATLKMISEMSLTDKLRINADLAILMKKDGKTGSIGKAAKKEKKEKNPDAPKRQAAAGTLAWMAFVKHCKTTMVDRFEDCSREPERLAVCKAIKAEDEEAYKIFITDFKTKHAESAEAPAAAPAAAAAPAPAVKMTAAEKLAALKAKKAAAAAPTPAAAPATKKEVKKAAPKKAAAAAAPAPEPVEDDSPKKTICGKTYFYDPETNGLWEMGSEGVLPWTWVGKFQEDEEEPILFCEQE